MLEDVVSRGTGKSAAIGRPAAGKTGTTSDYKDAWFVGYTPDLVAGVWVGNDDSTSTYGIMGGQTPAAIWQSFMSKALANVPVHDFDEMVVNLRHSAPKERPSNNYNPQSESTSDSNNYDNRPQENYQQDNRTEIYDNSQQTYNEPTYREPEPRYEEPARTYEPTYNEPAPTYNEPTYNEPAPRYEEPPAPSYDDAPSPGGDLSKGRN